MVDSMFNTEGTLTYPMKQKIMAIWDRDRFISLQFIFKDGLEYVSPWDYCVMPDRRWDNSSCNRFFCYLENQCCKLSNLLYLFYGLWCIFGEKVLDKYTRRPSTSGQGVFNRRISSEKNSRRLLWHRRWIFQSKNKMCCQCFRFTKNFKVQSLLHLIKLSLLIISNAGSQLYRKKNG